MNSNNYHKKILNKVGKYYNNDKLYYLQNIIHNKFYLNCWDKGIGKDYLNLLGGKNLFLIKIFIRNIKILVIDFFTNYYIENENKIKFENKYKYICISWALKDDFSIDGKYHDRYTNSHSRESKESIWILLNLGKKTPKNIDENIILITRKYSFKNLFKKILLYIRNYLFFKKDKENINLSITGYKKYNIVKKYISKVINSNEIKIVFTPYEAQPYQIGIFNFINKRYKDIITVGYIHSSLPPLPAEYFYRVGSPKLLLTHGKKQKNILIEKLNWNKNKIRNISSLRYSQKENLLPPNCIYLPYSIESNSKIIEEFKNLISKNKNFINSDLMIRNHPIMNNSKIHLELKKRLEFLIGKITKDLKKNIAYKEFVIVIGASAVVIELLELGYEVIHISQAPKFEVYSTYIWKGINIKKINNNIYIYELKRKGSFIKREKIHKNLFEVLTSFD